MKIITAYYRIKEDTYDPRDNSYKLDGDPLPKGAVILRINRCHSADSWTIEYMIEDEEITE